MGVRLIRRAVRVGMLVMVMVSVVVVVVVMGMAAWVVVVLMMVVAIMMMMEVAVRMVARGVGRNVLLGFDRDQRAGLEIGEPRLGLVAAPARFAHHSTSYSLILSC
jgi:hypothetical protein